MAHLSSSSRYTTTISPARLAELVEKARLAKAGERIAPPQKEVELNQAISSVSLDSSSGIVTQGLGKAGNLITYNKEQQDFITLVLQGANCVLTGAAGTGKTTCVMGAINSLIQSNRVPILQSHDHKHLPLNTPGIVAVSFTRRAVANLRKAMPAELRNNCLTIHKLLEFEPVFETVTDPTTHEEKTSMHFSPKRNAFNPLPMEIKVVYIDESSMVSVALDKQLREALPHDVQFVYIGDIQQLPPVFGSAILGFKMLEYKTVELTQVYRQALESPIIEYATMVKDGITIPLPEKIIKETPKGKITIHPWAKKISPDVALLTSAKFLTMALEAGGYDPNEDMVLVPFNKAFGTIELNKHIAQYIAKKEDRVVWEIIAGFNKLYFSVGDRVLYDKEDAEIIDIHRDPTYAGKKAQRESKTLDYWGHNPVVAPTESEDTYTSAEIDTMLDHMALISDKIGEDDERVRAASHIIKVRMIDTGQTFELKTASDLNALLLSYILTVHKAQGSEWKKVFFLLHQSHNTMVQRELLYTGMTRAAEELYILCEREHFISGVKSQKIKGNTLAEKAEWFKGKLESGVDY